MKPFRAPHESIGELDAETAATLVANSSDVALVLDRAGVIQDMAIQPSDLSLELEGHGRWFGRSWSETVSAESQPKVESILREAEKNTTSTWRQLTHRTIGGRDVPILYSAVKIGAGDRIVAMGRDLRAMSALQQRLIDAQMSLERDYAKMRFAETRYRLLFQTSAEPVLILDGASYKILETNPAAGALLDHGAKRAVGRLFIDLFTGANRTRIQAFLGELRTGSRADDADVTLGDAGPMTISAALFRQEAATLLLVRFAKQPQKPALSATTDTEAGRRLADLIEASPDGFVIADANGHLIAANSTFAGMVQVQDAAALKGAGLEQWLGRPGVDIDVMMMNLRQHGALRLFSTYLRGAEGAQVDVEVSAASLGRGKDATYGFAIRDIGRRLAPPPRPSQDLPHSAEQLTELIGRVPLKELVRETTDVIEKLCIEAALELTGDNRASAAEVLGLSPAEPLRQAAPVRLRRYQRRGRGLMSEAPPLSSLGQLSWLGIVRLGLVQTALGAIFVLSTSTLNRVMRVELALPAVLPGLLIALQYWIQVLRPRLGHGSDVGGRRDAARHRRHGDPRFRRRARRDRHRLDDTQLSCRHRPRRGGVRRDRDRCQRRGDGSPRASGAAHRAGPPPGRRDDRMVDDDRRLHRHRRCRRQAARSVFADASRRRRRRDLGRRVSRQLAGGRGRRGARVACSCGHEPPTQRSARRFARSGPSARRAASPSSCSSRCSPMAARSS